MEIKEGSNLKDEIRLLRGYTQTKLKELEKSLNNLIQFARDDLKRIDKLTDRVDKFNNSHDKKVCKNRISGKNQDGTYVEMDCGDFDYLCEDCVNAKGGEQ